MISLYYWIYTKHFSRFCSHDAILAKSSADGLMFMAVSDKNIGPRAVIIMFVVATIELHALFNELQHGFHN
jgi:hypothetical protein